MPNESVWDFRRKKRKEVKSGKERQTSLRILFFSSSSKSGKGKMERIKRAAEKRRAWLEVSTNNVYFIHPSLLTSLSPLATPIPFALFRNGRSQRSIVKEVARFFFLRTKSPLVYLFIAVVEQTKSKERCGRHWNCTPTVRSHRKVDDQRYYLTLA